MSRAEQRIIEDQNEERQACIDIIERARVAAAYFNGAAESDTPPNTNHMLQEGLALVRAYEVHLGMREDFRNLLAQLNKFFALVEDARLD